MKEVGKNENIGNRNALLLRNVGRDYAKQRLDLFHLIYLNKRRFFRKTGALKVQLKNLNSYSKFSNSYPCIYSISQILFLLQVGRNLFLTLLTWSSVSSSSSPFPRFSILPSSILWSSWKVSTSASLETGLGSLGLLWLSECRLSFRTRWKIWYT